MTIARPIILAAALAGAPDALAQTAAPAAIGPRQVQMVPRPTPDADALAEAMRRLGANPRDLASLIQAGELSLKLGDVNAAASLLKRAENVDPMNGRVKAGMARILLTQERPGEALRYFDQAVGYGLDAATFAGDRALAYDLIGEQERAQRDYRVALRTGRSEEIARRYALSLGISGRRKEALAEIDDQVRRNDRSAWRVRAFVLAMTGDVPGAEKIASTMMPGGMGTALAPFFARLAALPAADRAFAVHFGELRPTPQRLADARMVPPLPPLAPEAAPPVQVAAAEPVAAPATSRDDRRRAREEARRARQQARRLPRAASSAPQVAAVQPAPQQAAPTQATPTQAAPPAQPPVAVASAPTPAPAATSTASSRPMPSEAYAFQPPRYPGVAFAPPRPVVQSVPAQTPAPTPTPTPAPTPAAPSRPVEVAAAVTPQPGFSAATTSVPSSTTPVATAPAPTSRVSGSNVAVGAAPSTSTAAAATPASTPLAPAPAPASPPPSAVAATPAPVSPAMSEDTILARIMAGISIPGAELGVAPVRPPEPAPVPEPAPGTSIATPASVAAAADAKRAAEAEASKQQAIVADKPAPKVEKKTPEKEEAKVDPKKLAAEKKAAAAKKLADAKKAEEAKKAAEEARIEKANPSRIWVQVAGGANKADLPKAWAAAQEKAAALKGKAAYTTPLRFTNRLVTGPFKTDEEARDFVNTLARQGISAFPFTSDKGQKMERLPAK